MYVVKEYTPGYLPENEPVQFETLEDAEPYLASLRSELQEEGYELVGEETDSWFPIFSYYQKDENDLGRMVVCEREEE